MTTIAYDYHDKHIAVDSRATSGRDIKTDSMFKWFYDKNGDLYFWAGAINDLEAFKASKKERGELLSPPLELCGFVIKADNKEKVYKFSCDEHEGYWEIELYFSDAVGAGADFAIAAMDHGRCAKKAVEYAATKSCTTGGTIHLYHVKLGRFL